MRYSQKELPLYVQIAEGLIDKIESGILVAGEQLTSERELSKSLGVTRVTLRQALQLLQAEGLIERRRGSGNYIAEPKIERATSRLNPFTQGMRRSGFATGAEVILMDRRMAKISTANRLKVPVTSDLYYCHRVRSVNKQPIMIEKFYLPVHFFPGFDELNLDDRSIYEALQTEYNVYVHRAEQSLEAVAASEYEAALLGVPVGSPLLLERRLAFDRDDRPIEYAKDLYRGDRFKFLLNTSLEE